MQAGACLPIGWKDVSWSGVTRHSAQPHCETGYVLMVYRENMYIGYNPGPPTGWQVATDDDVREATEATMFACAPKEKAEP